MPFILSVFRLLSILSQKRKFKAEGYQVVCVQYVVFFWLPVAKKIAKSKQCKVPTSS